MATQQNPDDTVTVAPGVLVTIVRIATQGVDGVAEMASTSDRWLRFPGEEDGVRLNIEENSAVRVDVYIVANAAGSLFETSRRVQEEVSRTIQQYVGMKVLAVNVHIEDVIFKQQ